MFDNLRETLAHVVGHPRRFWREDHASLTVEAVLILPLLLWAFLAVYGFFDVYRERNLAIKGNFAISDLLSRETNNVTPAYMDGIASVYKYLTRSGSEAWVRVTVVHCNEDCADNDNRELDLEWSAATGTALELDQADLNQYYNEVVPIIPFGERVVMVETHKEFTPAFSARLTGVGARDLDDVVMTRPRFAPTLAWSDS